ncbi:MAG: hypothetical protein HY067_07820 [Betaproteobacteria bacterium]|nr:hypothetical protein [Betaproteobacteria bacterium]
MNIAGITSRLSLICLGALVCAVPAYVSAQSKSEDTTISPISMSANIPGLEISPNTIERWATQAELSLQQVEKMGLRPGYYDEMGIRKLRKIGGDQDLRRFIEYFDLEFGKTIDNVSLGTWERVSTLDAFIEDAVTFGDFDSRREADLRNSLRDAANEKIDDETRIKARSVAYRILSDARLAAVRKSRGYRLLADVLKRELEGREFVKNIGMIVEIRTSAKQPTISPVSLVTMECESSDSANRDLPTLVFTQRKRDCNEFGICRVESIAEVSKGPSYKTVFEALQIDGRKYLDGCSLITKMLIDGVEITRTLPGLFISHTAPLVR